MNTKTLKMMGAVAVAVALFAPTAGAVESSNCVGYNELGLANGRKDLRGVSFYAVGGESIKLDSLVPYDGKVVADDDFKIWWWNPNLRGGKIIGNEIAVRRGFYYVGDNEYPIRDGDEEYLDEGYIWLPEDPSVYVWANEDEDPIRWADKSFSAGTGFFTQPTAASPKLTISGQVLQPVENRAYFPVRLTNGQKVLIANPFPCAVALNDLVPFDGDPNDGGAVADDDFKVWWWNPNLRGGKIIGNEVAVRRGFYYVGDNEYPIRDGDEEYLDEGYIWLPEDPSVYVWANEDEDPIRWADKTFNAGEGFFTQPTAGAPYLCFPNPFYNGAAD